MNSRHIFFWFKNDAGHHYLNDDVTELDGKNLLEIYLIGDIHEGHYWYSLVFFFRLDTVQ